MPKFITVVDAEGVTHIVNVVNIMSFQIDLDNGLLCIVVSDKYVIYLDPVYNLEFIQSLTKKSIIK